MDRLPSDDRPWGAAAAVQRLHHCSPCVSRAGAYLCGGKGLLHIAQLLQVLLVRGNGVLQQRADLLFNLRKGARRSQSAGASQKVSGEWQWTMLGGIVVITPSTCSAQEARAQTADKTQAAAPAARAVHRVQRQGRGDCPHSPQRGDARWHWR